MYKNNSDFIAKPKVSKHKKGLSLAEKLVRISPLLLIFKPLPEIRTNHSVKRQKEE